MFSPLFTEVKLRGMGQAFPGANPAAGPGFQQAAPAPVPLAPAPTPMPTSVVPAASTAVLPPTPVVEAPPESPVKAKYVLGVVVAVAFLGALLIPSSKR